MEEKNLKLAQEDIDEALKTVEELERFLNEENSSKDEIKQRFIFLSNKVSELEDILKSEGII